MDSGFVNLKYFGDDGCFHEGGFSIDKGQFSRVGDTQSGTNLHGAYVIPGLIDLHTHGNAGHDFSFAGKEGLLMIARAHARLGVAGFCPTSMTLPEEDLLRSFSDAAALYENPPENGASLLGVHMEGPHISLARKGAQNPAFLRAPDLALFERLYAAAKGHIALVDIAPELDGAKDFILTVKDRVVLSLAHSDADYDTAAGAFDAGVRHVTHLFNAMPGLNHRQPGPLGAAAEREHVKVELIADGVHIHPSVIRLCFRLFGASRICLVSDSMEACGLADGIYHLGGQTVHVEGARAALEDGTIAGSVTPLYRCMQNAIRWGIKIEDAVRAASLTPAEELGVSAKYGSIANGKQASFVVANEAFDILCVYIRGKQIEL